jgi:hypothetical protein
VTVEDFKVDGEKLIYTAPPGSVTTFFETGY